VTYETSPTGGGSIISSATAGGSDAMERGKGELGVGEDGSVSANRPEEDLSRDLSEGKKKFLKQGVKRKHH